MPLQRLLATAARFRGFLAHNNFSTSSVLAGRAVVFSQTGSPSTAISCLSFPPLPSPRPTTVNIKFLLSPINPSDLNAIEGVYPSPLTPISDLATSGKGSKDHPVYVCGNEGLAEITAVGNDVCGFKKGDWVVLRKQQGGTWISGRNVHAQDIIRLPTEASNFKLSEVQAATMMVNPSTAYNMLYGFVDLAEGDWVIQNGANSSVGQAVIQIASARGLKTINFVRNRENISVLKEELLDLGATHVLTYDDLPKKTLRDQVRSWTGGKDIRLALNCLGSKETTLMTRLLGKDAHLVSYGGMSKQPFSLSTSQFIFKNLKCHGFWQSRWYIDHTLAERETLWRNLIMLMSTGRLKEPRHEIITIDARETDERAAQIVKDAIARTTEGWYGRKVLLKIREQVVGDLGH